MKVKCGLVTAAIIAILVLEIVSTFTVTQTYAANPDLTIKVYKDSQGKKAIEMRDKNGTKVSKKSLPNGATVRVTNEYGKSINKTVTFRKQIVHQAEMANGTSEDMTVGSPQLPAGANYRVHDPPDVLNITDTGALLAETSFYVDTVGGIVVPLNKLGLVAPYVGLALIIAVGAVVATVAYKRKKRN